MPNKKNLESKLNSSFNTNISLDNDIEIKEEELESVEEFNTQTSSTNQILNIKSIWENNKHVSLTDQNLNIVSFEL